MKYQLWWTLSAKQIRTKIRLECNDVNHTSFQFTNNVNFVYFFQQSPLHMQPQIYFIYSVWFWFQLYHCCPYQIPNKNLGIYLCFSRTLWWTQTLWISDPSSFTWIMKSLSISIYSLKELWLIPACIRTNFRDIS